MDENAATALDLKGIARWFTLAACSTKVVHAMTVVGDVALLVDRAEGSWAEVVARHPPLRATLQLDTRCAMVHTRPPSPQYLQVQVLHLPTTPADLRQLQLEKFVEARCRLPLDPGGPPFSLSLLVPEPHPQQPLQHCHLVLTSEHVLSDGLSGFAVLNDFLAFATAPTATGATPPPHQQQQATEPAVGQPQLPVHSSYLDLLESSWPKRMVLRMLAAALRLLVMRDAHHFRPLLPLALPPPLDAAPPPPPQPLQHCSVPRALLANGSPEGMAAAVACCRKEGVTVHGALVVVVAMALGEAHRRLVPLLLSTSGAAAAQQMGGDDAGDGGWGVWPRMVVTYNLRTRVTPQLLSSESVGAFTSGVPLYALGRRGVLSSEGFWDAARAGKVDTDRSARLFPLVETFFNEHSESELAAVLVCDSGGAYADATISNMGRYPFPLEHHTPTAAAPAAAEHQVELSAQQQQAPCAQQQHLTIQQVYCAKGLPRVAPAAYVSVTTTSRMHYVLVHKHEESVGTQLLQLVVSGMEAVGGVGREETVADVAERAFAGVGVHSSS